MKCEKCNIEVSEKVSAKRDCFTIPFSCNKCGSIKIKYNPVRDIVYVYQYPAPEKSKGGIVLVDEKYVGYVGGNYKETLRPNKAVILAFGPGYYDSKECVFV